MAHKQDATSEPFTLEGWQLLEVAGIDAAAFLQAQLMNDVRALVGGQWQWNGWLVPKGRLIALFALIALDEQHYWLLLPDFPAADLASRLKRFVFRSKLTLSVRDDCEILGQFGRAQLAQDARIHRYPEIDSEVVELDLSAEGGPRSIRIRKQNWAIRADHPSSESAASTLWNAFDLAHGLPHLPIEQSEAWTPQMLSLDRLDAYSLKKGCYPGQEIVARTHYLGQAKRGLVRISGEALKVGAEVHSADRALGIIVASTGTEALAVLSVDRPADGWQCGGSPCAELALLDGLAR